MAHHFSKVFSDTTEDHFDDNFKSYVDEKGIRIQEKSNDLRWRIQYTCFFSKKRYVLTYLTTKRVGWTIYSTNILNMVAHISSFAWHASSRLLLT